MIRHSEKHASKAAREAQADALEQLGYQSEMSAFKPMFDIVTP